MACDSLKLGEVLAARYPPPYLCSENFSASTEGDSARRRKRMSQDGTGSSGGSRGRVGSQGAANGLDDAGTLCRRHYLYRRSAGALYAGQFGYSLARSAPFPRGLDLLREWSYERIKRTRMGRRRGAKGTRPRSPDYLRDYDVKRAKGKILCCQVQFPRSEPMTPKVGEEATAIVQSMPQSAPPAAGRQRNMPRGRNFPPGWGDLPPLLPQDRTRPAPWRVGGCEEGCASLRRLFRLIF